MGRCGLVGTGDLNDGWRFVGVYGSPGSSPFVRRSRQPVGDDVDVGAFLEDVSL